MERDLADLLLAKMLNWNERAGQEFLLYLFLSSCELKYIVSVSLNAEI